MTLQCSVLSDSESKSCPGVHWFGVRSGKSPSNIIYTVGSDDNDKTTNAPSPPQTCAYRFSKNISSSDAGTYYCAVATCGEIIFGNGTQVDIEGNYHNSVEPVFPFYCLLEISNKLKRIPVFTDSIILYQLVPTQYLRILMAPLSNQMHIFQSFIMSYTFLSKSVCEEKN